MSDLKDRWDELRNALMGGSVDQQCKALDRVIDAKLEERIPGLGKPEWEDVAAWKARAESAERELAAAREAGWTQLEQWDACNLLERLARSLEALGPLVEAYREAKAEEHAERQAMEGGSMKNVAAEMLVWCSGTLRRRFEAADALADAVGGEA